MNKRSRTPALLVVAAGLVVGAVAAGCARPPDRVRPEAIQPPGDRLLDHAGLLAALERLKRSDRVTIKTIGTSAGGLAISMVVITAPGAKLADLRRQALQLSGPQVSYSTLESPTIVEPPLTGRLPRLQVPVLVAGASWGHEAAQVEGLVAAAEHLAFDRAPETERVLQRVVVLIVPCMNPDGREKAIAEWRRTPLSVGEDAVGNADGFMINRDFIHQTQPEARAILDVTRDWRPVLGVDQHEDMFGLGVAMPEVAFVPPFMRGLDVEEDLTTRAAIDVAGRAIAGRWRDAGFRVAYDPLGHSRFAPMPPPGSGQINPVAGSSGRLEFLWNIHAIPGLITESARTPGTQGWEARVAQKKLAALAAIETVAADPGFFVRTVSERREKEVHVGRVSGEFVAIPHEQSTGADAGEFRRLLRAHDVLVYETVGAPYDVIPLGQPDADFVRHAVIAARSKLNDLPAALGVRIVRSSEMGDAERRRLSTLPLKPVGDVREPWPPAASAARPGGGPTVAIYRGQGIDHTAWGELQFVLRWEGVGPVLLDREDVRAGRWGGATAVIFGDGAAHEIVEGWDRSALTRRAPWQVPAESRGIGAEGVAALAAFVRAGGRLVTIGRSAGLVVHPAAHLAAVTILNGSDGRPGIGQVRLKVTPAGQRLLAGVPVDSGSVHAFLHAPPAAEPGGYIFQAGDGSQVAAYYASAVTTDADRSFASTEPVSGSRHAAIILARAGRGEVAMFGIVPTFRAQWRSTFALLVNAATSPLEVATLPRR